MLDVLIWSKGRKVDQRWLWGILQVQAKNASATEDNPEISPIAVYPPESPARQPPYTINILI
jgi:hypothetical protein